MDDPLLRVIISACAGGVIVGTLAYFWIVYWQDKRYGPKPNDKEIE